VFPITPHIKANSWPDPEKGSMGVKMRDESIDQFAHMNTPTTKTYFGALGAEPHLSG